MAANLVAAKHGVNVNNVSATHFKKQMVHEDAFICHNSKPTLIIIQCLEAPLSRGGQVGYLSD